MADSISNGSENEVVADQFPAELPEANSGMLRHVLKPNLHKIRKQS